MIDERSAVKKETDALASGLYAQCRAAAEFLNTWVKKQIWPFIQSATEETLVEREVIIGQLRRADEWLVTLSKLDSPFDYQAVAAGCRALLEIAIDIVLLTESPAQAAKVAAWERSAKLKSAMCVKDFHERRKTEPDEDGAGLILWAKTNAANVVSERRAHGWSDRKGTPRHPERWTGSRNLLIDAQAADRLGTSFRFEEFYETRFRELSALTHGSGQQYRLILDSPVFSFLPGRCFAECTNLGFLCTERVLTWLKAWTPETRAEFKHGFEQATIQAWVTRQRALGQPLVLPKK
jgi:hypothetical protein